MNIKQNSRYGIFFDSSPNWDEGELRIPGFKCWVSDDVYTPWEKAEIFAKTNKLIYDATDQ